MASHEPQQRDERDDTGDATSTTGGAGVERGEHVGRVAGADTGYAGETGAERRADAGADTTGSHPEDGSRG